MARTAFHERALDYAGYDASDYVDLHPDLISVDPDRHFLDYGLWERRAAVAPERFAARLAEARRRAFATGAPQLKNPQLCYRAAVGLKPSLHAPCPLSTETTELVDAVLASFRQLGISSEIYLTPPQRGGSAIVFDPVALFGHVSSESADLELYQSCLFVTHRAPDDHAFIHELPFLLAAGAVGAWEFDTFALLAAAGVPAAWLGWDGRDAPRSPPTSSLIAGLQRATKAFDSAEPWRRRPIDVASIQTVTELPSRTLAHIAGRMDDLTTVVRSDAGESGPMQSVRRYILERSKIALHLEAGSFAPPSWRWLADVAAAGAVLVSEPLPPHPLLRKGANYFEAAAPLIPELIRELLDTEAGRLSAAQAAVALHDVFKDHGDPELTGLKIVGLLDAIQGERR